MSAPQKQFGFSMATATVPLGDMTSAQMRVIARAGARVRRRHDPRHDGSGSRVPLGQRRPTCASCIGRLAAAGLGLAEAGTIADVASCPGAESCRLAVTQSRGLGRLLEDHLRARPDLIEAADGARIKISGCPNGCGQHHIATIGFQGSVRRIGSKRRAAVLRHGGRRHRARRRELRPAGVEGSRAPDSGRRRASDRDVREGTERRRIGARLLRAGSTSTRVQLTLADLERLTNGGSRCPTDFVDLAEVGASSRRK